jgi:mercuric reductase
VEAFDLVILGGGASAFGAAIKANDLGARTAMINHGLPLGGTCVNVGCVPSKTLLWAAEVLHQANHHRIPGLDLAVTRFDFAAVVRDEQALVERMRRDKYQQVLEQLTNVTFVEGRGRLVSPTAIEVNGLELGARKVLIATGSTATVPPIPGLRETGYVTHIEALALERQPETLVVIGGGPIGLEFSQMYARFGTKVTLLHRRSSVFRHTEVPLAQRLVEILRHEGLDVVTDANVEGVRSENGRKVVTYRVGETRHVVPADEILLAAGKTPNTEGLGLDTAGIEVDGRAIRVQPSLKTSHPDVYAAGDVASLPRRLEITAGREGTMAAENALTGSEKSIDYDTVPYTVFTDPQLAGVGITEAEQMERMGVCACRTVSLADVPKAIIMRRTEGLIRMVVHPRNGQIMGVHLLAPQAGELVAEATMLVRNRNTIHDVIDALPMFPTLSEGIKLAATAFTRDISKLSCCV